MLLGQLGVALHKTRVVGDLPIPDQQLVELAKADYQAEYKRRHDKILPELVELLRRHRLRDDQIFLDPKTYILFAVQHHTEDAAPDALPYDPLVRRWFAQVADIMEIDAAGVPSVTPIAEVFHID